MVVAMGAMLIEQLDPIDKADIRIILHIFSLPAVTFILWRKPQIFKADLPQPTNSTKMAAQTKVSQCRDKAEKPTDRAPFL